jgi:hypothetical protein
MMLDPQQESRDSPYFFYDDKWRFKVGAAKVGTVPTFRGRE